MADSIDKEMKDIMGDRPFTHQDIIYLQNLHPSIRAMNPIGSFEGVMVPQVSDSAVSGWKVIRYGKDVICSAPTEFVASGGDNDAFMQGILGGGVNLPSASGTGTIVKQTHDAAAEVIKMATESNWSGIAVVYGTPLMKQILWQLCEEKGLKLEAYEPDQEVKDKVKREQRIKERLGEVAEFKEMIQPK